MREAIGRFLWVVLFCLLRVPLVEAVAADFCVVSSSAEACVFAYSPSSFRLDTLILNGGVYHRVRFALASHEGRTGDPMVPCRILVVGVPPQGGVRVSVVSSDLVEERGVRLAPVPVLEEKDGLSWEKYREGAKYRQAGFTPGLLYEVEEPGYFGSQRVVRIKVYPVQFSPTENTIRRYTEIVLRVEFGGGGEGVSPGKSLPNEELYREALVNYGQARKWRIKPRGKLTKAGRFFQAGERYKIPISQEGVYKVSGNFLDNRGIDIGSIQPSTLKVYNNGGQELPRDLCL